ncbi:MAG TPA: hypothetical protein PKD85_03335, partial [Saprospiraceae bacterium]|nr:hypothetical protein [Saprospiraceae bacterium]
MDFTHIKSFQFKFSYYPTLILLFCIICFITLDSKYTQLATNQGAKLSAVDLPKDYIYLPAIFIYKDIKRLEWLPNIQEKYEIGETKNIYYHDKSNLKLLRGSSGTALALLPAFIVAHMVCNITDYEQDGYSL